MKKSKGSLLKSILSLALTSTLVLGAVPIDALVTEARAQTTRSVKYTLSIESNNRDFRLKGNDGTQTDIYELSMGCEETSFSLGNDVTIGVKATDGQNLYVQTADAEGKEYGFQNSSLSITVTSRTDYISKIELWGWQKINNGEKYSQTRKTVYAESRSYTADWSNLGALTRISVYYCDTDPSTLPRYNISYNLNGGTNSPNNPDKYREGQHIVLEEPTRGGYIFMYWLNESGNRTSGVLPDSEGDRRFEAVWNNENIWYPITYDLNGGTLESGENPDRYNVESDPITLIDPTRKGYRFIGWTGTNVETPQTPLIIPTGSYGSRSYTANWEKNNYSITFRTGGGGTLVSDKTMAQIGDTVTVTATPGNTGLTTLLSVSYTDGNETKYAVVTSIGDNRYTFSMPPANVTVSADYSDGMSYVDENGVGQKLTESFSEIVDVGTLTSGWYFVKDEKTISEIRININGDVKLILCDGASLSVPKGINLINGNKLTIYGQTAGSGTLTINAVDHGCAGIGGDLNNGDCGNLVINGGRIDVKSCQNTVNRAAGAGIGGGLNGSGGYITINGGSVTATGGTGGNADGAAGIGGGGSGRSGLITINGGTVKATGKYGSAGIGSGHYSKDTATVTINGGTVEAHGDTTGNMSGAGIGGGDGDPGNVVINGGNVTVTNGIGGGSRAGGTVRLGWTQLSDFIDSDSYRGTVTLSDNFLLDGTETIAVADNIAGKKIVPTMLSTYTVKFDKNSDDATGDMEDMHFLSGKAQKLSRSSFTREHYYFDGWNNGSGVSFTDGQTVNNLSYKEGDTITLYARWKAVDYDITIDSMTNGYVYAKAENSEYVNSAHYNDIVSLVMIPDDGYAPETPSITPEGGIETEVNETGGVYSFTMPDKAVTVKASFKQHEHHFTYESNGSSIRAKCDAAYCPLTDSEAYLTINAPEDLSYDGTAKTASVTGSIPGVDTPAITYKKDGRDYNKTPVEEGRYTASITLNGVTASVTYTISLTPVVKYKVTVNNGTGTGSYEEGATVSITANEAPDGMVFDKWTGTEGLTFTSGSETTAAASFIMPKKDVTVTAVNSEKKEEAEEEKDPVKKPDKVPFTEPGETYASSNDNFAAYAPGSENGIGGKITKLILDFSKVGESSVSPADLMMTVISGSQLTTKMPLKDKGSFKADEGIKVKVNKKTLIPTVTVKKDGKLTLQLSDGNTYTVYFKEEKPKAEKKEKKQKKGSGILKRSVKDLFKTTIDSGKLSITSKKNKAEVSGNTIVFDTEEKDSLKVVYKYLNKKYKMTIKIK